jgi:LacI family transcriptional regulator/LacI family repressor for deo operon, udp, cdd, tsx, nupC, and nupG
MAQVSIKDIARAAGVSYSTVSRALNDNPAISQEVRTRIQGLAQAMGYTPNALAQGLLSQQTHSIGMVVTSISDLFFVDMLKSVEEAAQEAGISLFLASSNNAREREIKILETLNRRRVDGVIITASRISREYISRLEEMRIPVVMVNTQVEGDYQNISSLYVDDYAGGRMAMQHLLDLGHQRIGYIGVNNRSGSNARRMEAYLDALKEHGIAPQEDWICINQATRWGDLESDLQAGQCRVFELIQSGITALFCFSDTVAVGAILACRKLGIDVPAQVSVVGFDDSELCEIVSPPLTTVSQPKQEMGQTALRMLLASINGSRVPDTVVMPSLVIRESTAPPRADRTLNPTQS